MNNELMEHKSWWKRNWKWFVVFSGIVLLIMSVFISSRMGDIGADLAQAYSDNELYENAIEKVKSDKKVTEILGEIEPIDKLAILEGEVHFTNNNQTVNSSIRIKGGKGKARMDIEAHKINNTWVYKLINVRIKNPAEKKQTIKILTTE